MLRVGPTVHPINIEESNACVCVPDSYMIAATKISAEGVGPQTGNAPQMFIYFIVYIVVIPFFFLKLFIALIIVTFQEQGDVELEEYDITQNEVISCCS